VILPVWGGATYPQLRAYDSAHGTSRLYFTDGKGLPQVKLAIAVEETGLALNRLASREIRRRRSGFLMRFALTLRLPGNAELLDFIYEALRNNWPLYLRPHPNCLYWPAPYPPSDEWQVVIDGQFDWAYFNDKWVGHDVVLKLVATQEMDSPPISVSTAGFVPVAYETVGGTLTPTATSTLTFWNERMWAGAYDLKDGVDAVAFWEP